MENIYVEASIIKSLNNKKWDTDKNGNPIVIIEASNENLDYQGEKVQRSALMNSKDDFLKNGVISYDHKHLPSPDNFKWDPEWNAEKYVIGKPLDAWEAQNSKGEMTVFVKAVLYKSNAIAKEIIGKLDDGAETVKASVGGRRVSKAVKMDTKTYKDIPTIIGVDWNEVALTYKPVNQTLGHTTLSPKEFVKALTAGSESNPSEMKGGNTLQVQSLDMNPIRALVDDIKARKICKSSEVISYLVKSGYSDEDAGKVLKMIKNKTKLIGDVVMGEDADKIDDATNELEKALENLEGLDVMSKGMKDGNYVCKGGHMYMKKADGSYEKMDKDSPDYNGDEDKDDDMGKSIVDEPEVFIEAEDIVAIQKSIKENSETLKDVVDMLKAIPEIMNVQNGLLKAIGNSTKEQDELLKSISESPAGRQTGAIKTQDRFQGPQGEGALKGYNRSSLLKSMSDAGFDSIARGQVDIVARRGGMTAVEKQFPGVVAQITKGA